MVVEKENLGFAFNDFDFTDRILRLEIIQDNDCINVPAKKPRVEKSPEQFSSIHADHGLDSGPKVVTLRISSPILASRSPFFHKLFKNGMRESHQESDVALRINASEVAAFMELLNFMYGNTLNATSSPDLINVLMVADKFEVTSCMRYSVQLLLSLPMSLENALDYLELPSSVLVSEIVQPLIDEAKKYIGACYKNFTKHQEEAMTWPLSIIEVVLASEGLQVTSEDDVYDFVLEWVHANYPEPEDRRRVLTNRLVKLICFPNLSSSKLKEVLVCADFDHEQASKLVMNALFSKAELPSTDFGHSGHAGLDSRCAYSSNNIACAITTDFFGRSGRVYSPSCVAYFGLKKDEVKSLSISKPLYSQPLFLGGEQLYLMVQRSREQEQHFGLYLYKSSSAQTWSLRYDFAVMNKSSRQFQSKSKSKNITFQGVTWGVEDLFGMPWTELMSDDSDYFIDDILHLRADITLVDTSYP